MPTRTSTLSGNMVERTAINTSEGAYNSIERNYPYVARIVGGNLTTNGIQYSSITTGSTSISTKSSNYTTVLGTTISWPGLDGEYIDELEFGLTWEHQSSVSTCGFIWQMKNATGSTWENIMAAPIAYKSTAYGSQPRTVSGYRTRRDASMSAGYNRLPFNLRLRGYNKTANKMYARVKNSSYVKIKAKRN